MLRSAFAFALTAATLSNAAAAPSPLAEPMSFVLMRASGPACDPDCPEWIAAQGEIKPGAANVFRAFVAKLDGGGGRC